MKKMPVRWEPVLGIVRATNSQELHDYWQKISAHWREFQEAGKIKGFSTPAALCPSPIWMGRNRDRLLGINFQAAHQTLTETLEAEGFSVEAFSPAFALLDDYNASPIPACHCRIGGPNYLNRRAGGF